MYFSRYFIHEMLLVCFTIGLVAATVGWLQSRRETFLYVAAASAGLMFATKETAVISAIVLAAAALGAAWLVEARLNARAGQPVAPPWRGAFLRRVVGYALDPHSRGRRQLASWLFAAAIFLAVNVIFYTSFFTHPEVAIDAIRALALWTSTGTSSHTHPWYAYLAWLAQEEMPVLLLGTAGAALALWKADNQFAVFTALWSIGMLAAYSMIPVQDALAHAEHHCASGDERRVWCRTGMAPPRRHWTRRGIERCRGPWARRGVSGCRAQLRPI